jgi:hypothetical protein
VPHFTGNAEQKINRILLVSFGLALSQANQGLNILQFKIVGVFTAGFLATNIKGLRLVFVRKQSPLKTLLSKIKPSRR